MMSTPVRALKFLRQTIAVFVSLLLAVAPTHAESKHGTVDSNIDWAAGGVRIEYDNDLLVNSDNKFTNGVSIQWHSRIAGSWDEIGAPGWLKFGRFLPGMRSSNSYNRLGLAIGQNMQTPNDLSATDLIVDVF